MSNIKFTRTTYRDNLNVPLYEDGEEFTEYMIKTYVETGKCLEWRSVVHNENLSMVTSIWTSEEALQEAFADQKLKDNYNEMKLYYDQNEIIYFEGTELLS